MSWMTPSALFFYSLEKTAGFLGFWIEQQLCFLMIIILFFHCDINNSLFSVQYVNSLQTSNYSCLAWGKLQTRSASKLFLAPNWSSWTKLPIQRLMNSDRLNKLWVWFQALYLGLISLVSIKSTIGRASNIIPLFSCPFFIPATSSQCWGYLDKLPAVRL